MLTVRNTKHVQPTPHATPDLPPPPVARLSAKQIADQLTLIGPKVSLDFLGEDSSGGPARMVHKRGPFPKLTASTFTDVVRKAFGFKDPAKVLGCEAYAPERHQELWDCFGEDYAEGVEKLKKLLQGATIFTCVVDTRGAWKGTGFLLVQLKDGGLVGLRGEVAGMTL